MRKINTKKSLGLGLTLGVCLMSFTVMAQEINSANNAVEQIPVDFPGRSSLSDMKEGPLPSLSDSVIKDAAQMDRAPSKRDLPSEQLLGRITTEVFHEMADLERGNVVLKLQAEREELKNNLEELKARYRQARLDEIERREQVIRSRVEWQQEQERIRQEILEKKLQTEKLEKELEAAETEKEELLPLDEDPTLDPAEEIEEEEEDEEEEIEVEEEIEEEKEPEFAIEQILDIKGMKGRLTARIVGNDGKSLTLKKDMTLPSGHKVKKITKTDIVLEKDGSLQHFNISELSKASSSNKKEETVEELQTDAGVADKTSKAQRRAASKRGAPKPAERTEETDTKEV